MVDHTIKLPSGIHATLSPLTGNKELILTSQHLIKTGQVIDQVLVNCTKILDSKTNPTIDQIRDLRSGDRLVILIEIRKISYGSTVEVATKCSNNCGFVNASVDLDNLPSTDYSKETFFNFKLPSSGKTVEFLHLDGHMEAKMAKSKVNIHSAILARTKSIDGTAITLGKLKELPAGDLRSLRAEMTKTEAGIDTNIIISCSVCGKANKLKLEGQADFLYPDMM